MEAIVTAVMEAVEQEEGLLFIIQPRLIVALIRLMEGQVIKLLVQELFI